MRRRWEYYVSPGGGDPVTKAINKGKLTDSELARLEDLMNRAEVDKLLPREREPLRDGVLELRMQGDRRIFRLAYAEVGAEVLLALHFFGKKRQNARIDVDLATVRWRMWRAQKR